MMIFATNLNYLYFSILFYLISKIVCYFSNRRIMHYKPSTTLSSIPERSETEEYKWIPKKKHDVLKAKYKCLKKLFQIYDASVIGMLPENDGAGDTTSVVEDIDESRRSRKRRRCHRVKLDACAGTSDHEIQTGVEVECSDTNTCVSESCTKVPSKVIAATQASRESLVPSEHECGHPQAPHINMFQPSPLVLRPRMHRPRKRTRFQGFLQRLLGIRDSTPHHGCALEPAVSECDLQQSLRRRRRIRFRRSRRPTRAQSEVAMRAPVQAHICAQSVQQTCLLDTTPRHCPIAGCRMMLYGIINYNDHLNLCHFASRRYVCHFCHEGFEREEDKVQHESEHVGLRHLTPLPPSAPPSCLRSAIASVTQTEPEPAKEQDEKLKKIVSFFDKIVDSSQLLTDIKKSRHSEMNFRTGKRPTDRQTEVSACDGHSKYTSSCSDITGKRLTYSCNDVRRGRNYHSLPSDAMSQCCSANCNFCGENYDYSQTQERKFGEFRSCGVLPSHRRTVTDDGHIAVSSVASSCLGLDQCVSSVASSVGNCNGVLSLTDHYNDTKPARKLSTSVVFTATDCNRKIQSSRSLADKFKSYKWEPCTRIIRV